MFYIIRNRLAISALALLAGAGIAFAQSPPNSGGLTPSAPPGGSGTVTSVAISGGTTGLTTSGGPITAAGTITIAGTLAAANGGTGLTSLGTGVATALGTALNGTGAISATGSPNFTGTIGIGSSLISGPSSGLFDFGDGDSLSPVPQTLQFQGYSGGLNQTAPNVTINLPVGTGTGAGGTLLVYGAPAGTSGSTPNTRSTTFPAFQLSSTGVALINSSLSVGNGGSGNFTAAGNVQSVLGNSATEIGFVATGRTTFFTTPSSGVWLLGGPDIAAPVAQSLEVNSVAAGNANVSGANFTIRGSLSNGSGSSDIIIQTTAASASSGVQNAGVAALTLKGGTQAAIFSGQITLASSTTGSGAQTFTNSPCTGLTTERWVPVAITGQSGTWYVPACQ